MAKKVCKNCDMIYEGEKCPNCGNQEHSEEIKGRLIILNPEESEVAKNTGKNEKGTYAIKSS